MMQLRSHDAYTNQLLRLLIEIAQPTIGANVVLLETCATLLGYLDRFSVDQTLTSNLN